ncbi:MAG: N-acetyltransferase family protein, partial [Hyphomicrobiales bacterium]
MAHYPEALFAGPLQLRDGQRVWFRPIRPDDAERLRRFHRRLSPESQRLRFFSPLRELSQRMADQFAHVDYERRGAAVVCYPGEDEIRGVGRYESNGDGSAEVAFVLEDCLQGKGVGKELLRLVAHHLRARGYHGLTAMVLPENAAMLGMFERCGHPARV